jgi:NAD(P)-dependent dehydrogenase (short-subunit alcohol dehydrogenase family)
MTDASEFAGEVVLVTAAAGLGIGQATARRLAAGGANVVVTDIHPGRTEKVAKSLRDDFPDSQVLGIPLDAGDRGQIDAAVENVLDAFGRIDILVNNAAVNIIKPVFDCEPDDWDRVMAVNINGPWYLARRVLPIMRERQHGVIVNVTSYAGDVGGAGIETPYAVSKGALNTLTRCLAHEAGPFGIRVNSVSPGLTEGTKFMLDHPEIRHRADAQGPLGSLPHKDEIAEAIAFLASARAGHITGEILNISAGAYMRN